MDMSIIKYTGEYASSQLSLLPSPPENYEKLKPLFQAACYSAAPFGWNLGVIGCYALLHATRLSELATINPAGLFPIAASGIFMGTCALQTTQGQLHNFVDRLCWIYDPKNSSQLAYSAEHRPKIEKTLSKIIKSLAISSLLITLTGLTVASQESNVITWFGGGIGLLSVTGKIALQILRHAGRTI